MLTDAPQLTTASKGRCGFLKGGNAKGGLADTSALAPTQGEGHAVARRGPEWRRGGDKGNAATTGGFVGGGGVRYV